MERVTYKNVHVPKEIACLMPHMSDAESYREELRTLAGQWDLLTILGQMSGTGSDMTATQEAFQTLTDELLGHLARETLKKTTLEIGAVAQVAVDILIRNLFERTADIGFLATDEDIRQYVLACSREGENPEKKAQLIKRFREYVAKYSVYHNIILMDCEGTILAQLDESAVLTKSRDPLIQEALLTSEDFVEVFRHSDLDPQTSESLIYAFRVTENNDSDSTALGVLCLCFRFDNEMEGIFSNLISQEDWSIISILDPNGKVIASSDPHQVPKGAVLERVLDEEYKIVRFSGREYLARTCATKGYQGFFGLGWQGHVMLPLDHAFKSGKRGGNAARIDEEVSAAVMKDPHLFSDDLRNIPIKADAIQKDLDRTVWNGNVRQNTTQSKVLLWNISATGERTKQVFESSIGNLHQTVISTILDDVAFQAALAVDIMDRNLYERANDCRWWALTSAFRKILSEGEVTEDKARTVTEILRYINGLYTVYTNLFVYDVSGRVVAVSNDNEARMVGKTLKARWVKDTLAITDSQAYSVSSFEPSPLYGGRHTYIYGASIADPTAKDAIVGGIGIVFDSFPQFKAMLADCLPQDGAGNVRPGFFGVFCDRGRNVISSTCADIKPGDILEVDKEFFATENGGGVSRIIRYNEKYFAVGSRVSSGYREYKKKDHYTNDVIALMFAPLAKIDAEAGRGKKDYRAVGHNFANTSGEDAIDAATFFVGDKHYAFRTSVVSRAMGVEGLTSIPGSHELLLGKIVDDECAIPVVDLKMMTTGESGGIAEDSQIIVVQGTHGKTGLLVDALGPIPSIPKEKIDFNTSLLDRADKYTEGVMMPPDCKSHTEMIVLLDADRMQAYLADLGTFDLKRPEKNPAGFFKSGIYGVAEEDTEAEQA